MKKIERRHKFEIKFQLSSRSAIVVIRFNQSRHTMAAMLESKINEMKAVLQEDAVVQHIVSDPFEALEFANNNVYNNLRHGSKRVLITITDGTHRDMKDVSNANVKILTETMTKYRTCGNNEK